MEADSTFGPIWIVPTKEAALWPGRSAGPWLRRALHHVLSFRRSDPVWRIHQQVAFMEKVMIKSIASVVLALVASIGWVHAAEMPGATKTEIRIGGIFPFSGPASAVSAVGKGIMAYVQSINDRG